MNALHELKRRLGAALSGLVDDPAPLTELLRPSQDPKFGDYQANCAMPLAKQLDQPAREIAAEIVGRLDVVDLCEPPEIAGPGFINFRLRDDWLSGQLASALGDPRLGIAPVDHPRTFVIDYSAPNVAKPMHVGHIRSTVIGDSLYRTLRFLGHRVIGDNHLGDWGTQFGMIIYGYKHFLDRAAYDKNPVEELSRLYRLVNRLVDYHAGRDELNALQQKLAQQQQSLEQSQDPRAPAASKLDKKAEKSLRQLQKACDETRAEIAALQAKRAAVESDPLVGRLAREHPEIGRAVLLETVRLHGGDPENVKLWREFMPPCLADIQRIYDRLGVSFDHTLGESFYHDRLRGVVADLIHKGLARESEGALCVFLSGFDAPMIVQKRDGAYLYATTDLATLAYRVEHWHPDAILYVVDHRQSGHFAQLFAATRLWGLDKVELEHISFGTVLGDDGRPYKTRSGDTVGLWGLLDEAVRKAYDVVSTNSPDLPPEEQRRIAEVVGIAALKYADLSQNRTSDYVFSYEKMLALNGNTATYMQYAYARVRSIFAKGRIDVEGLRSSGAAIELEQPVERALALELLRFSEALEMTVADYRPNQLTNYLFDLGDRYSAFYESCPVLRAESEKTRNSRLLLCDLTARTLKQGLALLGIDVVEKM